MAWLEQRPWGQFHIAFRFGETRFKQSLRTEDRKTAEARLHRLEENIRLVESGRLQIPDDADIARFLLSDGQLNGKPVKKCCIRTLVDLSKAFFASIPDGSLEESTVKGMRTHERHLMRILGKSLPILGITLEELQRYVDHRATEKGIRGKNVSTATIKKELTTLRGMWNWARHADQITRNFPQKGLRYPKIVEKPPFQTYAEISRKIARGGLSADEESALWECLFLTAGEIDELLTHVEKASLQPFIYPMFVFAAHTGARRSEMIRSQLDDIDLDGGTITIREKKRVRGKLTTRTVPVSPRLSCVLKDWFDLHPGGPFTFCHQRKVLRSKTHRDGTTMLTRDEAHDHFKRTLSECRWNKAKGWHVFRHSFCSNCAGAGLDQRIINAWVGHQTEEMVRRYRHLIPNQQQEAIRAVFGDTPIPSPSRAEPRLHRH